jgi:ABC-type proline/glycine betaine transport system permease subunit
LRAALVVQSVGVWLKQIMNLSIPANIATALTVIIGVVLGLIEARRARREREERAAIATVNPS